MQKPYSAKTLVSPRSLGLGLEGQMVAVPQKLLKEDLKVTFQGEYIVIKKGAYPVHEETFPDKFVKGATYTMHYFMFDGKPDDGGEQISLHNVFEGVDPSITERDWFKETKAKLGRRQV